MSAAYACGNEAKTMGLIIGLLVTVILFLIFMPKTTEAVTSRISFGICDPKVIGVAPGWASPTNPQPINFGIDPESGCLFSTADVGNLPIIFLTDESQIQRFIAANRV